MERDDLIEYSLDTHHSEEQGKQIRSKILKVTVLLTLITVIEVALGAFIKQSSEAWPFVKWTFIGFNTSQSWVHRDGIHAPW